MNAREAGGIGAHAGGGVQLSLLVLYFQKQLDGLPPAVAKAAMDSGVATRPIEDFQAYRDRLTQFVYHSGLLMKPIFTAAKKSPKRIVYAEGEDERVLRAVQVVLESHPNTLWLPPQAVRKFQGNTFVVVQDGSAQRRVDVKLGLSTDEQVEILQGLSEGQVVVAP